MKSIKYTSLLIALAALTGCGTPTNTTTNTNRTNANATNTANTNSATTLGEVPRPQKIAEEMTTRIEQDNAEPTITVVEPKNNSTVASSTVKVKLSLSGD